jgi:hypothetical protein
VVTFFFGDSVGAQASGGDELRQEKFSDGMFIILPLKIVYMYFPSVEL